MKKHRKGSPYKNYLLFAFILLLMIGSLTSYCFGEEESERKIRFGFSAFGGTGEALARSGRPAMNVFGFLPRIDLTLFKHFDLEFEGNYSYWNITGEKDLYFAGVNANLLFKPIEKSWGSLFLLGGGGLGYDNAGKHRVSQIGDSHCGGILQVGAGAFINLGKQWALRGEYRLYHISDPFRKDRGLNTHIFLLGFSH